MQKISQTEDTLRPHLKTITPLLTTSKVNQNHCAMHHIFVIKAMDSETNEYMNEEVILTFNSQARNY